MDLGTSLGKQSLKVIRWNEPAHGGLAYRFPMQNVEIENGGRLIVRNSQMAVFVNQGRIAGVFRPGHYTLNQRNLPVLADLMNSGKEFESHIKSDVYFFSTRLQIDHMWGTVTPLTVRDTEFGAVPVRAFGVYSYRIVDPLTFFTLISGIRESYTVGELEHQLRNTIIAGTTDVLAASDITFLGMTANEAALSAKISDVVKTAFTALGLELSHFVVEHISLPEELQKSLDQRIGMNIVGDNDRCT